jgi:hypothetical protein
MMYDPLKKYAMKNIPASKGAGNFFTHYSILGKSNR